MSIETGMSIDVNVYEVADFYADVFEVEKNEEIVSEEITNDENMFNADVVLFNNEVNRYDKLRENGQLEMEKRLKDIYQTEIHWISWHVSRTLIEQGSFFDAVASFFKTTKSVHLWNTKNNRGVSNYEKRK